MLMDKMKCGPFISNYGIKLHDPVFHYESGIAKMHSHISRALSGKKRVKSKDVEEKVSLDKAKTTESKDAPPADDPTKSVDVS